MEYPFDSYSMSLFSRVYIEVIGVKGVPPLIPAPYSVTVKNLVSGWDSSESASKSIGITDFNTYELGITLSRYWVVTGFSVFVVVIMWLLSLGMFSMVFDVYFCHPTMLSGKAQCSCRALNMTDNISLTLSSWGCYCHWPSFLPPWLA